MSEFRSVNRTLGIQPKIGPFALHQIVPFLFSLIFTYVLKDLLGFDWLIAALMVGAITGGSLAILGNQPWRFFAQIKPCPRVVRGGAFYLRIRNNRTSP